MSSVQLLKRKVCRYKNLMLEYLSYGDHENYEYWRLELIYLLKQIFIKQNSQLTRRITFNTFYNYLVSSV
jgi:hypothetical protein